MDDGATNAAQALLVADHRLTVMRHEIRAGRAVSETSLKEAKGEIKQALRELDAAGHIDLRELVEAKSVSHD